MRSRTLGLLVTLALLAGMLPVAMAADGPARPTGVEPAAAPAASPQPISLSRIGRYNPGPFRDEDPRAAEIVAFDPGSDRMFVVNSFTSTVDIVSLANPANPILAATITISPTYGAAANSVDVFGGVVAVAVEADPKTSPGKVVFFNAANGNLLTQATVGALPDMLTFSPDGKFVLTANEGEPNSYNQPDSVDPEGSVSIIAMPAAGTTPASLNGASLTVDTVGFTAFNAGGPRSGEVDPGIRIFGPGASVAQDLEPEYVAVSPDSSTAYVTLQENNALAIINIAAKSVTALLPLGYKDHSLPGKGLDPSDRDSGVQIASWPVRGMYMPDAIAAYQVSGQTYLVTANEGDARDYDGFAEEIRVGSSSYTLDPAAFPNASALKANASLGRLTVTTATGDVGGDGDFDAIYAFGARSFTIWNASTGAIVYDSGDELEKRTAATFPANFNADSVGDSRDNRSDNKGPEPEAVELATIGGRTYAFVGLERIGGVMVYDVTEPASPSFVQYVTARSFPGTYADGTPDDLGPEGITFVSAADSPSGSPLLLVANEASGSVSVYQIAVGSNPDGAGSLTLLHNNDGESAVLGQTNTVTRPGQSNVNLPVGSIAAFAAVTEREVDLARDLGNAVLNVYAGDAFLPSSALACSLPPDATTPVYDAVGQALLPYTAHALGNHEFDYTPVFLKRFIEGFGGNQPFLSANLDFSAQPGFAPLIDADGLIEQAPEDGRVIGRSMLYTDPATGQRFGIVGATTPLLPTISSPDDVVVTPTLDATAAAVQAEVDRLQTLGVRKIILVSHMQSLTQDRELIGKLRGVDIVVAGGGDDLLTNPTIDNAVELLPGDTPPQGSPTYPLEQADADGRTTYIVTTAGNYRYVGRLDVEFDADGEISQIVTAQSYPRRVIPTSAEATTLGVADAVTPSAGLETAVKTPIDACLATFAATPVARSEVVFDVSRNTVRTRESNFGNLVSDAFLHAYDQYADDAGLPVRGPANPVVAFQNGGGIRQTAGDAVPTTAPGTISRKNTLDILAFSNFVTVVSDVAPAELKEIFERSAASLPGQGGQFLQVAGLRVTYNISNTAQVVSSPPPGGVTGTITTPGSRVVDITLDDGRPIVRDGQPVPGAPNVRVVTNSFTASGGDNYPTLAAKPDQIDLRDANGAISYEGALLEYLATFPVAEGLPTVGAADLRYQPGGYGRIQRVTTATLPPTGGTITAADGSLKLDVPAGAFGNQPVNVELTPLGGPTPGRNTPAGVLTFSIETTPVAPTAQVVQTSGLYTITATYSDARLAATGLRETALRVLTRNESGAWVDATASPPCVAAGCSQTIDTANNRVTLVVDYTGEFTVGGYRLFLPLAGR